MSAILNGYDPNHFRPSVCTLVGPTRFFEAFDYCAYRLGRLGWLVFSIGSHRADDARLDSTDAERNVYHDTHRQKIRMSDLVFVVDLAMKDYITPNPVPPYIGDDTAAEIGYAKTINTPVLRLSDMYNRPWPTVLSPTPAMRPMSQIGPTWHGGHYAGPSPAMGDD